MRKTVILILFVCLGSLSGPLCAAGPGPDFEQCKTELKALAITKGISTETIASVLDTVQYSARVIELDRRQPEFTRTFGDYYQRRVTFRRVSQGRALLAKHADLLQRVQDQTGVPAPYLVSFWGLETNFGSNFGKMSVPDSLTTLACDPRRSDYFTSELMAALRIVETGDISAGKMLGSWAGAMGHVQFMPSAFLRYALDGDGDGRRDLWGSIPDAMFSAGNFLQHLGWQRNLRWGREVLLPVNFDFVLANSGQQRPLSDWRVLGIKDAFHHPLPVMDIPSELLVPSGYKGPAFLTYHNFDVIMGWNRSEFYALAVGRLADRIAGAGRLAKSPPDTGITISRDRVLQMQLDLNVLGHDAGEADGVPGPATRAAISRYQQSEGLVADGYLNLELLEAVHVSSSGIE